MQQERLRFLVANDPEHDLDLMQEAYIDDELTAIVRQTDDGWTVTFVSEQPLLDISWEDLTTIHRVFSLFVAEMTELEKTEQREAQP